MSWCDWYFLGQRVSVSRGMRRRRNSYIVGDKRVFVLVIIDFCARLSLCRRKRKFGSFMNVSNRKENLPKPFAPEFVELRVLFPKTVDMADEFLL